MRSRFRAAALLLTALAVGHSNTARGQACPTPRTALVLSGGGAKGLAHIGVLRALDSLGIRPDLVVGSSMGAILGAMYASGYSGREIDSLARKLPISQLFRSYQPALPRVLGPLRPLVVWEQGDRGFVLQSAAVRETAVNLLVARAMLRGNLIGRGRFDSLPIPFIAVATDLQNRDPVPLRTGDLARAVRASFAIPLIFPPVEIDGRYLADGGLSANVPVGIARRAGADRVIVSDATERAADSLDLASPVVLADRLLGFLFEQRRDSLGPGDIRIRPAVDGYASLDFSPAHVSQLIELGRRAADTVLSSPRCADTPSQASAQLPRVVGSVAVQPNGAGDAARVAPYLGLVPGQPLDAGRVSARLRALEASERERAVWLRPSGRGDTVSFDIAVVPAPRRVAGLGIAYDNELGGAVWAAFVNRRLANSPLEAGGVLELAELERWLRAQSRWEGTVLDRLLAPDASAEIGQYDIRRFGSAGTELPALKVDQFTAALGLEADLGDEWSATAGIEGRSWRVPDQPALGAVGPFARVVKTAATSAEELFLAEAAATPRYRRALVRGRLTGRIGSVLLVGDVQLGWGDRLPPQLAFALGGNDGFPGLHIGERLGDRMVMTQLEVVQRIRGPLLFRLEAAVGRSVVGGALLGTGGWIGGARAGIGADTPVGPVRAEYGVATNGRHALLVRLGRVL